MAKEYFQDYRGAIEDYSEAIEIDSTYADAFLNRGYAKKSLGDFKGALQDWVMAGKKGSLGTEELINDILPLIAKENNY